MRSLNLHYLAVFLCVYISIANALFDATDTYNHIFNIAMAAGAPNPGQCITNTIPNVEPNPEIYLVNVNCSFFILIDDQNEDKTATCQGIVGISHQKGEIWIAFRGTNNDEQLEQEKFAYNLSQVDFYSVGMVNQYFKNAFDALKDGGIYSNFTKLAIGNNYPVIIAGHSLGGALSSLMALYIAKMVHGFDVSRIQLTTFGEPRVGNLDYVTNLNTFFPNKYRVVDRTDIVPHLPLLSMNGNTIPNYYYHTRNEIWYKNYMPETDITEYIECDAGESPICSNQQEQYWKFDINRNKINYSDLDLLNHIFYYSFNVTLYASTNCVEKECGANNAECDPLLFGYDCCSGKCTNFKCCMPNNYTCSQDSDCCTDKCDGSKCTCLPNDSDCQDDSQCCTGRCLFKCYCISNGDLCTTGESCCSGLCVNNRCQATKTCPTQNGWVQFNNYCYLVVNNPVDWFTAETMCTNLDSSATLASIDNAFLNSNIQGNLLPNQNYSIGAYTNGSLTSNWKWVNNDAFAYLNWANNYPTTKNQLTYTCAYMYQNNGKWYNQDCSKLTNYVCLIPL